MKFERWTNQFRCIRHSYITGILDSYKLFAVMLETMLSTLNAKIHYITNIELERYETFRRIMKEDLIIQKEALAGIEI